MLKMMPHISGSGLFDSRLAFPEKSHTSPRTVTEYELELFTEDGGVSEIAGKQYPIKAGNVLLARPGDTRRSRLHFKCLFAHFECADEAFSRAVCALPRVIAVGHPTEYSALFSRLTVAANSSGDAAQLEAAAVLLSILSRLVAHYTAPADAALPFTPLVRTAQRFMDKHYTEPLTLADIAAGCNLSPTYFHRQYTAAAGHTPHAYLADKRIEKAKLMLRTVDVTLAQVADACGFASQSYFCACFRQAVGMSPGDYRKTVRYPDA